LRIENKSAAMKALIDFFTQEETPEKIMDFDGYRLEFRHWWFNIRPSNTEPYLRLIMEAETASLLEEKKGRALKVLEEFK
ncbi:MAG TPA: hypothetical protein VHO68_05590, partial [Bacteroidales bacterium]|nr:hypothetical protein [Bacteroidales bacterium]